MQTRQELSDSILKHVSTVCISDCAGNCIYCRIRVELFPPMQSAIVRMFEVGTLNANKARVE